MRTICSWGGLHSSCWAACAGLGWPLWYPLFVFPCSTAINADRFTYYVYIGVYTFVDTHICKPALSPCYICNIAFRRSIMSSCWVNQSSWSDCGEFTHQSASYHACTTETWAQKKASSHAGATSFIEKWKWNFSGSICGNGGYKWRNDGRRDVWWGIGSVENEWMYVLYFLWNHCLFSHNLYCSIK